MWIWGSKFRQYSLVVPLPFITYLIQGFSLETFKVDAVTLESSPPPLLPDQFLIQTIIQSRVSTMFLSHEQSIRPGKDHFFSGKFTSGVE